MATYTIEQIEKVGGKEWQKGDYHRVYINGLGSIYNAAGGLKGLSKSDARRLHQNVNIMKLWYDVNTNEWQYSTGDLSQEKADEIATIIIAQLESSLNQIVTQDVKIESGYAKSNNNETFEGISSQVKMIMERDDVSQSFAASRVCATLTTEEIIAYLQSYKPNWWEAKNVIKNLQNDNKFLQDAQGFLAMLVDSQMRFGIK